MTVLLVALAFAFAWSIGSHYTGACMGMPYALGAISARNALLLMAPLALLGAWLASGKVATTVGRLPGAAAVARPSAWGADVVVNATTVGEAAGELPADFALLGALAPGVRFFDLNNRPGPLQQAAVSAGCITISGVMMQLVTNALRVALLAGTAAPITGPFTPPLTTANG